MFDVSWGELFVVVGAGLFLVGKKDLPKAAHTLGNQVGRVVGLLQGARARADRFAEHSELRQLQNELRSGLRELDAVRSEMAVSMTPGGLMGRSLGAMTASANRVQPQSTQQRPTMPPPAPTAVSPTATPAPTSGDMPSTTPPLQGNQPFSQPSMISSSVHQSTAAVAEQEWAKQGISFQSAAERGAGLSPSHNPEQAGSAILSNLMQQSLVFDQYDRTVAEQDAALQSKVSSILQAKEDARSGKDERKKV